jgi:NAD-dependent dihydropyrimidine dehydrogenase PreA subunit
MKASALPSYVYDTVFRLLPHRAPTGLVRIGDPGRDAPVVVTGNYTLTVRRIREALAGEDVWLLVANSKGINVWCAAGGGHLTHHDVISVVRTSGVDDLVSHRTLMLPQLGATGIERRKVTEATGWTATWGPARLEDLRDHVRRGGSVRKSERMMTFPLWERMEMAVMWALPITAVGTAVLALALGWREALTIGVVAPLTVFVTFAALPWMNITDRSRWVTFGAVALLGGAAAAGLLDYLAASSLQTDLSVVGAVFAAVGILSVDLAGTTPWYPSHINTRNERVRIELRTDRCTGAADCVQVCPRGVLNMNGSERKVEIVRAADCIECGACIVQCPEDALFFRYDDGRVVEPATIRSTRMNMLGKRTVHVRHDSPA